MKAKTTITTARDEKKYLRHRCLPYWSLKEIEDLPLGTVLEDYTGDLWLRIDGDKDILMIGLWGDLTMSVLDSKTLNRGSLPFRRLPPGTRYSFNTEDNDD